MPAPLCKGLCRLGRMFEFTDLRDELAKYLAPEQMAEVSEAYLVANEAHKGQKRRTGEPYISHPLAVARILAGMRMDHHSIMAAILHDVLEDTKVEKADIEEKFGSTVAELVDGVSKLTQIKFENMAEQQAENFRKMLLAMVRDIRVILVKLADRLHNMRTLSALPVVKRRRIARETLEIYAPIANRLGMHNFQVEFEELGFTAHYPFRARTIAEAVARARGNRKEILSMITSTLRKGLQQVNISADALHGREKHLYSIYKKMRKKNLSLSQIMDFYAFRIIVDDEDSCYRVLGLVHGLYKPVPGRFKDYIAIPKANGYQSLHTTLFGPYGVPIEIQIRTSAMENMAEQGIAAHWLYKTPEASVNEASASARQWLSGLMEIQKHDGSTPAEFMQDVKVDLFPDEVYIFTPKGDIMELPTGATAVDFAYAVHTAIGNSCVAVRIDRQLAPLSSQLVNGQTIEVITASGARPNPAWLNFVVTGKARSNIRHFMKSQQQEESITLGKRLLDSSLSIHNKSITDLSVEQFAPVLAEFSLKSVDELYCDIGLGNRTALLVARRLLEEVAANKTEVPAEMPETDSTPLAIKGTEGMVVDFAKCCWPIPGDPIVGCIHSGRGLTIHAEFCHQIAKLREHPEQCVLLRWADDTEGDFQVKVAITLANERGMLASLASAIASTGANIDMIHTEDRDDGRYTKASLVLSVEGRIHLAQIIRRIRLLKSVSKIVRDK